MAKNVNKPGMVRSTGSGQFVLKETAKTGQSAKTIAGSVLTKRPGKASAGSVRVIKDVSNEHRDALKRLVDR
jgi:hypothetical protein